MDCVHKIESMWKLRLEQIEVPLLKELVEFTTANKRWKDAGDRLPENLEQ